MPTTTLDVLPLDMTPSQQEQVVRTRSILCRLRNRIGASEPIVTNGDIYWPVLFIHATADGRWLRKEWTERVYGAMDLITGRIGLVDAAVPCAEPRAVPESRRLAPAFRPAEALEKWHEFFRDYVERKRKPLQPPVYRVDDHVHAWLPHHVVAAGNTTFLVDPVTRRPEPIDDVPKVREQLAHHGEVIPHPELQRSI